MYKHCIRINKNNQIVYGFSTAFESPQETDICISEAAGRHFELLGETNPSLLNENNQWKYQYINGEILNNTSFDIEPIKQSKKQEINQMCEQTIYNGIDIETSQGLKHFSLTNHDQTNLLGYALEVAKAKLGLLSIINLEQGVWYHADGEDHCYWNVEDFEKIENAATIFKVNQLTYCKALKDYVSSLETIDDIQAIEYGMKVQGLD